MNGLTATRYSDETFAKAGFGLVDGQNTFTAIATEGTRSSTNSVTVNLPASVDFTYDANGSMTGDERRTFVYDGENQLIRVTVAGEWEVRFTYDGKMRKRKQQDYVWDGNSWELLKERRYIYDGMLAIQERDQYNTPRVTYTRGRDLSGTLQGAGGIGGLLARTDNGQLMAGTGDPYAYYHADGNGNVTMLVNSSEIPVAKYHYDSYGNKISATGPLAEANTYRFSSKEYHAKSSLYYYGYRFYDPNLQRWLNRDPLGEAGFETYRRRRGIVYGDGPNLYAFVRNSPITGIDFFGLQLGRGGLWPSPNSPKDPCPCGEAANQVIAVGPVDARTAQALAQEALAAALASGLPGLHNGQADAFRHCFWSCRMAQEIGTDQAKEVGDIHERCNRNPPGEEAMDLANNAIGRRFGSPGADCNSSCLQAAQDGTLQTSPGGTPPAHTY